MREMSIQDSNPRPLERESLLITTRPGILNETAKALKVNVDSQGNLFNLNLPLYLVHVVFHTIDVSRGLCD